MQASKLPWLIEIWYNISCKSRFISFSSKCAHAGNLANYDELSLNKRWHILCFYHNEKKQLLSLYKIVPFSQLSFIFYVWCVQKYLFVERNESRSKCFFWYCSLFLNELWQNIVAYPHSLYLSTMFFESGYRLSLFPLGKFFDTLLSS